MLSVEVLGCGCEASLTLAVNDALRRPVWFLRVVVSVFLQTFYVSAMGIFFVNINCHWLAPADSEHQRGYMDNYPTLSKRTPKIQSLLMGA